MRPATPSGAGAGDPKGSLAPADPSLVLTASRLDVHHLDDALSSLQVTGAVRERQAQPHERGVEQLCSTIVRRGGTVSRSGGGA
jgi:hypothetical protein